MKIIALLSLLLTAWGYSHAQLPDPMIIPQPLKMEKRSGSFEVNSSTAIACAKGLNNEAGFLAGYIAAQTGIKTEVSTTTMSKNCIALMLDSLIESPEGYILTVETGNIQIKGKTPTGIFYGIQSLMQLIPIAQSERVNIPAVNVVDAPRFSYRGMHLDVCRHFFDVAFIKKTLDAMAHHKLNRFHWHLTEDQGWRIEIKKYPELTQIGAWRNGTLIGHAENRPEQYDTIRYGGFYTQEQVKEVVAYAAARHITVIPEIELPGHAQAALATYPHLGCFNEKMEAWKGWGVSTNVYCAGKESTFEFIENVLAEVAELFPGEYIHIGGDECPKENWLRCPHCQARMKTENLADMHALQSYFIHRIEKFLNAKGKSIIGWDEILEGGLAENATVMSWRGNEGGIAASQMGHDVIMTPNEFCYFDHYQANPAKEPLAFGGMTTIEKVYGYEPMPTVLNQTEQKHVIGTQANVWTEYIPTSSHAEYMIFPRLCAMAEVCWTVPANKNLPDFMTRLRKHQSMLDHLELNYRRLDQ